MEGKKQTKEEKKLFLGNRLCWGDSLISEYDINMLNPNEWLGDGFIDFWFQVCKSSFDESVDDDEKSSVSFWPPSLVEMLSLIGEKSERKMSKQ